MRFLIAQALRRLAHRVHPMPPIVITLPKWNTDEIARAVAREAMRNRDDNGNDA